MKKDRIRTLNNRVIVDYIYIKPLAVSPLIDPNNPNKKVGADFEDHPFQALVIKAPEVYRDNGMEYKSPLKDGDIVHLTGFPMEKAIDVFKIKIDGRVYHAIRHSDILSFYTPTEEERKSLEFHYDMKDK